MSSKITNFDSKENPQNSASEMDTKKADIQEVKDYVTDFTSDCSIHGVKNTLRGDYHLALRIVWGVFILFMLAGCLATVSDSMRTYFRHETRTTTERIWKQNTKFPSVTICNVNYFSRKYTLQKYPDLTQALQGGANFADVPDTVLNETALNIFTELLPSINETFINCSWISKNIPCSEYIGLIAIDNAVCYHFPKDDTVLDLTILQPGPEFGLSVLMDIHQEDYLLPMFDLYSAGMKVMVTDHEVQPVATISSINLAPGKQYNLGVTREETNRLSTPYAETECISDGDYSYDSCLAECQNNIRYGNCNCTLLSSGADACVLRNALTCADFTAQDYFNGKCQCKPACTEILYRTTISTLSYPSDFYYNFKMNALYNRTKDDIQNNFVFLKVFLNRMEHTIITQNPALTGIELIADIGGTLGLYLGASLVSIVEVTDFIIRLVYYKATTRKTVKENAL